ncbi:MAG TPA: polyketide cyclase / dehydrase and lipid transport [Jatrophihabitans sp.]
MPGLMWEVDVLDATWIGVPPTVLAAVVAEPGNWRRWWPDLDVHASELRGPKGVRWIVRSAAGGRAAGSMEIWLQEEGDGTIAHYFLRLDGTLRPLSPRQRRDTEREFRVRIKQIMWALGDRLDPGRLARVAGPPTRIP